MPDSDQTRIHGKGQVSESFRLEFQHTKGSHEGSLLYVVSARHVGYNFTVCLGCVHFYTISDGTITHHL